MIRMTLVLLALLLAACASNDKIELEPVELTDIDHPLKIKKLWSAGVGSGQGDKYNLLEPTIAEGQIFAADFKGRVFSFDLEKGKKRWKTDLDMPLSGGVGSGSGKVFVGSESGVLVALNSSDGKEMWRAQLSSEVLSPATTNGDVVAVQTLDGKIVALDANTGENRWQFDNTLPALTLRGTPGPLLTYDTVYVALDSGKVQAFSSRDGILQWEQRVAIAQGRSELDRVVDIDGSPVLVGDVLIAASYQGRIMAMNRATGRPMWAQEESTYQNLGTGLGYVYLVDATDTVKAYNANTGQLMWTNDQLLRRHLSAPQAFDGYIAVADFEGYVHILNQVDGTIVARRKVDGDGVSAPMAASYDVLYVVGDSGDLEAIKVQP